MTVRQRTAIHEAGHVIVGRALGCRPAGASVTSVGADDARGRAWFTVGRERNTLNDIIDELAVDLAGHVAVAAAEGQDWRELPLNACHGLEEFEGQHNSRREIVEDVAYLLEPEYDHPAGAELAAMHWFDRALPKAAARAARILERDWAEVSRLADRLAAAGRVEFVA